MIRIVTTVRFGTEVLDDEEFTDITSARRALTEMVRVGVADFAETDEELENAGRLLAAAQTAVPDNMRIHLDGRTVVGLVTR